MRIQPWEIDALNDSELASYIIVSYETSQLDNPAENFYLMGACATALFITLAGAFPIIFQDIQTIIPSYTIITIASLFIGLFLFGVGYHKSKVQTQQMRQTFGEIMSRHPLFLQAIRKFSGLPDIGNSEREEYLERIKEIEEKMADQPPS